MTALTTVAQGEGSAIAEPRRAIVRDGGEWLALWAAHAGPGQPAPAVDFATRMVAAAFAGERATPGHQISITGARRDGASLVLFVDERRPAAERIAAQMIVTPFHIVTLPRDDGQVRFENRGGPVKAGDPRHRAAVSAAAPVANTVSTTGLDPHIAAAMAYLAGPFSGVLVLLAERTHRYVRFHAWQAIVGLGGLGALAAAALVTSFLTLLVSPFAFLLVYRLWELLGVVWLVVWGICLVKAYKGEAWKMPIAGKYAERLAARR